MGEGHNRHEVADVKASRGRVEPDVPGGSIGADPFVQFRLMCSVIKEAPFGQYPNRIFNLPHGLFPVHMNVGATLNDGDFCLAIRLIFCDFIIECCWNKETYLLAYSTARVSRITMTLI
jgi:hypothetical protein